MASEIRVNKIANRVGLSTVEYTDTGIIVSGIVTCTEVSGLNALNIAGVSTFASPLDINGDIDVDGHTNLDNLSVAGVSTFAGAIDLNADLDVDGHTNLDNVSIAGVTTFSNAINVANGTISRTSTGNKLIFQTDLETRLFHSSNNHVKLTFYGSGETLRGSIEAQATQIQIKDSGGRSGLVVAHGAESRLYFNDYQKFTTTNTGAVVTGILTATTFSGSGANLTNIPAGNLTGTVADARISTLTASKLTGALPAISGANLTNLPPSAPVGGSASNKVFFENDKVVSVNYQITSTKNAMTAGPVSINSGIGVTVPSGCSWTIV